ncbi:hypothetical protein [Paenibacillus alkalitolerans]|uniref:hypothetical protein n=1 Tax=Paenibacillus alkalitolerans TaxID=2799335 RepID=UPI0018F3DFD2|nr:hypothetical protein [Paenibacillus alkalitolerans]
MSRKWERMVQKNKEKINKQREKHGQAPVAGGDGEMTVRGRSWLLPLALALAGLLFAVTLPPAAGSDSLYQITIILYFVLALFHFLVRRPYLKIGKSQLSWRTYTGEKTLTASEIGTIRMTTGDVVIEGKDGKTRRTFSRRMHLYPMDRLTDAVRQFAAKHQINLQEDSGARVKAD